MITYHSRRTSSQPLFYLLLQGSFSGVIAIILAYKLSVPTALRLEIEDRKAGIIKEGEYLTDQQS